jgi:Domain of unknown function (DUF4105)
MIRLVSKTGLVLATVIAALAALWSVGAFYFDFPWPAVRSVAAVFLALALLSAVIFVRGSWRKIGSVFAVFAAVLAWWLTLKPLTDRMWQPDVARTASAEIHGDEVTFHNVRNCDYRSDTEFTPRWETRAVRLSKLTGIDMAINYWGSPYMAHPIISFQFADAPPICFSIETRREAGESYSALGGIYRQYELIYIVADERDAIRVRTNFRKGEDVYLYRLKITPDNARGRFLDYVTALNQLHIKPRWYHAVTTNCTTSIRNQHNSAKRSPWDWRILVNGKADEMLYQRGALHTGGLVFAELKSRSRINAAAVAADTAPDFSARIRAAAPSFYP